jgi:probable rRNA maturation factor
MQKVFFHYADRNLSIKEKKSIHQSVEYIFQNENKPLNRMDYIFCSDDYLLEINKTYLKHDFYTDIVTFDLSIKNSDETIGEIYISVDRIIDNAKKLNQPLYNEKLRVIFHGALHLCGYLDKKEADEKLMRSKEDFYIQYHLNK